MGTCPSETIEPVFKVQIEMVFHTSYLNTYFTFFQKVFGRRREPVCRYAVAISFAFHVVVFLVVLAWISVDIVCVSKNAVVHVILSLIQLY